MKKFLTLITTFICVAGLMACAAGRRDDESQAYFIAKVLEVNEKSLLVEVTDNGNCGITVGTRASVTTELASAYTCPVCAEGDHVRIGFDGTVLETYPLQINTVYAIDLTDTEGDVIAQSHAGDPSDVEFSAQYIRTDGCVDGAEYPHVVIIRSVSELENYYQVNRDTYFLERRETVYSDETIGFLDACDEYDESFFEDHILVMVLLEEGSGSIRHQVEGVTCLGDKLNIDIESIEPEIGTCDMAQWHILIELDAEVEISSPSDILVNGQELTRSAYSLRTEGVDVLLSEPLEDTYLAGETVSVRVAGVYSTYQGYVIAYLNGARLETTPTMEGGGYCNYDFVMPSRDSVLEFLIEPM